MTLPQTFIDAGPSMSSAASAAGTDYKALVVVTLLGGVDAHSFVIPTGANYSQYSSVRGANAVAQPTPLTGQVCGFHPNCTGLTGLFNAGRLAIVANVGVLAEPLSPTMWVQHNTYPFNIQYRMPLQIGSHVDFVEHWNTMQPENPLADTGWAGRLMDLLSAYNGTPVVPAGVTVSGRTRLLEGYDFKQYRLTTVGPTPINSGSNWGGAMDTNLLSFSTQSPAIFTNIHEKELQALINRGSATAATVKNAIATYTPATVFPTTSLGQQLNMVSRMIAQRSTFGHRRDVFYVSMGGFDTHNSSAGGDFPTLMTQLSEALTAFDTELASVNGVNLRDKVTTFTTSDFGRTLVLNASNGSDHGWGGHHVVFGGAVRGGKVFNKTTALDTTVAETGFPNITLGGPNDIGQGRLLPQISVQEYMATIVKWFGVPDTLSNGVIPLRLVIPFLDRFKTPNLGFML